MTLQGPELAIDRLHPEFVVRLANAIREARSAGLPFAGVFSAYRPPAFGSRGLLRQVQLAAHLWARRRYAGHRAARLTEAQTWHAIAARNGVVCPYGPRDRAEWDHCQPTSVKMILAANPLRETVSAAGPFDLESMFEAGNPLIASMAGAAGPCQGRGNAGAHLGRYRQQGGEVRTPGCRSPQNETKLARPHGARHRQISAAREAGHSHGRGQNAADRSRGRPTEIEIRRRLASGHGASHGSRSSVLARLLQTTTDGLMLYFLVLHSKCQLDLS